MSDSTAAVLSQILEQLKSLQESQADLQSKFNALTTTQAHWSPRSQSATSDIPHPPSPSASIPSAFSTRPAAQTPEPGALPSSTNVVSSSSTGAITKTDVKEEKGAPEKRPQVLYPNRVIITTYPDQSGIKPTPLSWGASTPTARGPIVCSRNPASIKLRNAIGAHSGSYSIYRALAVAIGTLDPNYKPDYTMTEPPVEWFFKEKEAWTRKVAGNITKGKEGGAPWGIVSFDPWGHLVQTVYNNEIGSGLDIRPSIAITKAHIKLSEIDQEVRNGLIPVDGKIVIRSQPLIDPVTNQPVSADPGVELVTVKAAVEPVWHLPGVAERFGIPEALLRRALFEDTGGMYPELITRPDIQVFLPPIGGLTVYIFGNPEFIDDESKELTLRVHDECNGSDVFGSDICTCKPYLTFAIAECVLTAQRGGVGIVVYFRKEGRALGEVTKYLVYNLRKRGGDSADRYFKSTEMVAGVKDMRFQALMPDVLHWLGVKKIDNMVSMSDMKYDAIVSSGIPIKKRYDIPEHLIPPDSRVEIDAKIAAGYFTSGKKITEADLAKTVGRAWEETEH
jgi:GTP cyclohydrolase II